MNNDNFEGKLIELNTLIKSKLDKLSGKQDSKIAYLHTVKTEIGKIPVKSEENPQGLLSQVFF